MPAIAPPPNFDIFISHSAKDREFATRLANDLVGAGLSVWLDQWNIRVGDSFADAIDQAIRASRFVMIVMSPDYSIGLDKAGMAVWACQ